MPYVFTEAFPVVTAGEVQVSVEVEVVGREFSHSHDGLLTFVFYGMCPGLLLSFTHQTLLQTGNHLSLRVDVLPQSERYL